MRGFIYLVKRLMAYKRAMYYYRKSKKYNRKFEEQCDIHHKYYEKLCDINSGGKE